jgi:hypothetical protein
VLTRAHFPDRQRRDGWPAARWLAVQWPTRRWPAATICESAVSSSMDAVALGCAQPVRAMMEPGRIPPGACATAENPFRISRRCLARKWRAGAQAASEPLRQAASNVRGEPLDVPAQRNSRDRNDRGWSHCPDPNGPRSVVAEFGLAVLAQPHETALHACGPRFAAQTGAHVLAVLTTPDRLQRPCPSPGSRLRTHPNPE